MSDDDVIIRVGSPIQVKQTAGLPQSSPGSAAVNDLGGWTAVRIQRSCEHFPSVFEIIATERFPGDDLNVPVKPGDPCQVLFTRGLGRDVIITGYVDVVTPILSANQHSISIIGRSKCADLADCSAVWPSGQFNNMSVLTIAQNLATPFGITVKIVGAEAKPIPKLVFHWGETPYELIERLARFNELLVYDDPDGNLVLGNAGTVKAASGVAEGQNVLRARVAYSMDQRYSEYRVRRLTFAPFNDSGADPEGDIIAVIKDDGVPRSRPLYIIAEIPQGLGNDYGLKRGQWEASRRFGRSTQISVTVDSWRDANGDPWAPNTEIDVDLPTLKAGIAQKTTWIIATVTFRRDERGTEADLVIMPKGAFDILPIPLTPQLNTL